MIIAIDGPAASGKGTLARRLARHLAFAYLDTGKLYRAVGLTVLRCGGDPGAEADAVSAARALDLRMLADEALSLDEAAGAASKVAVFPGVRAALLDIQRAFATSPPDGLPGAVLDGRDIGTQVCPDADLKIFVTASAEARAKRRFLELRGRGMDVNEDAVLQDLNHRDERDRTRAASPMEPASDAVILDTSELDADQVFTAALEIVLRKRPASV